MKLLLFIPLIVVFKLTKHEIKLTSFPETIDSTSIEHKLDGLTGEWPIEKFIDDKSGKIYYATDNDQEFLYLALLIDDKELQQKVIFNGMTLYLDSKGMQKESHGVEFPVITDDFNPETKNTNMRIFGFGNDEIQNVETAGTINIAMSWDTTYRLQFEYNIPLKMVRSANNRTIGIGWKINETPGNRSQPVATTSGVDYRPRRTASGERNNAVSRESTLQKKIPKPDGSNGFSVRTTHTISFE